MTRSVLAAGVVACLLAADVVVAQVDIPKGPCGSKPPAQQQRRKGGEGVPPLPLPATPLRRTERKRPPAPPSLIAKIQYGAVKVIKDSGGEEIKYWDWDKDKGDIPVLLTVANPALNMNYTFKSGPLSAFPADPAQYPIYYYTGSDDFTLSDAEVERLREYVRAGGTIWGNCCYGDPDFFKAFIREMGRVLPDRRFHEMPPDHAMFNCFYQIKNVAYTRQVPDAPNGELHFSGMDLGCRTAVVLSRYGLSCGWDGHIREGAFNIHPNDARKLGVNMIAYALASHPIGMYQAVAKNYYQDEDRPRGEFILAQARVGENWDCQFNEIANLLKAVATRTSTEIKFERKIVELGKNDLQTYPFLYITGHYGFELKPEEQQGLKNYVAHGGFVLASPCCGSREFDVAFRREMGKLFGSDHPLQPLPEQHPVYSVLNSIKSVHYTDYTENIGEKPPALPLEGIGIGASTPVIYAPYGLGGWRGFDNPFGRDFAAEDATKLGVNIVLYSMTH